MKQKQIYKNYRKKSLSKFTGLVKVTLISLTISLFQFYHSRLKRLILTRNITTKTKIIKGTVLRKLINCSFFQQAFILPIKLVFVKKL